MRPPCAPRSPALSPSTFVPPLASVAHDTPPGEAYETALRRRLALVASLAGQASDAARTPLARREAARLATSTLGAAAALLGGWRDDLAFEGAGLSSWASQAADDLGDELARAHARLALVVAELPRAADRLARTLPPVPASRRAGGAS